MKYKFFVGTWSQLSASVSQRKLVASTNMKTGPVQMPNEWSSDAREPENCTLTSDHAPYLNIKKGVIHLHITPIIPIFPLVFNNLSHVWNHPA